MLESATDGKMCRRVGGGDVREDVGRDASADAQVRVVPHYSYPNPPRCCYLVFHDSLNPLPVPEVQDSGLD